jgi:4-hydroxy-2-oxoheptanedioate aldolase
MHATIKERLRQGETVYGPFFGTGCPDFVEIAGLAGFDFLIIDTEHGPGNPESIQNSIRAAELRGIAPVVRVTSADSQTILRTLDVGAAGVQVPQVNDVECARNVARWSKYFPLGVRGAAMPRSSSYGMRQLDEYFRQANEDTLVVVHCENVEGLGRLPEIASVEGIDVVFVGPYDLSQSLGIPGQISHPKMVEAVDRALRITQEAGKIPGIFATSVEEAKRRVAQGFRYIAYSMDILLFASVCREVVQALRKA